jgi:hypothetical protein
MFCNDDDDDDDDNTNSNNNNNNNNNLRRKYRAIVGSKFSRTPRNPHDRGRDYRETAVLQLEHCVCYVAAEKSPTSKDKSSRAKEFPVF